MTERLLRVDDGVEGYQGVWIGEAMVTSVAPGLAAEARAELDRLYAAAEANQAPGPDWKAKLREEVEAKYGDDYMSWWNDAIKWVLELIDALPDPPTPDPDAPPVYVPPEGHVTPVLGRDVPDGWEGRRYESDPWWRAAWCRDGHPTTLFEVRRVPAPEPATEWVPLHQLRRGMTIPGASAPIHDWGTALGMPGEFEWWPEGGERLSAPLHVRDDGMVEVLAEGER